MAGLPYELRISERNQKFHLDLDDDILHKKNGMFSFVVKVNDGNIINYVVLEYESTTGLELGKDLPTCDSGGESSKAKMG